MLFGIGLFGASLLAAAILPITTTYVVSESSASRRASGGRREAPVFVGSSLLIVGTLVAVIPGVPVISLLIGVQV